MFKSLRNRLILINLGVTSAVILVVFAGIYLASTRSAEDRAPRRETVISFGTGDFNGDGVSEDFQAIIDTEIREEREAAARQLLITLVISGVMIEVTVAIVSYFMAEEAIKPVREAYEAQKVFIANASHEIKTPLAAIAANLEAADLRGNKWISNVEAETAKLTELNKSLLTLARTDLVEAGRVEEVEVSKVVEKNLEILAPRMKNLVVEKKILSREKRRINRGDFAQIISCLLDNAIKYGKSKVCVEVGDGYVSVTNDGKGIDARDLPHVFERFYQVDKSSEGVGLGLSIAKATAERNGWKLSVESGGGETKFTLRF